MQNLKKIRLKAKEERRFKQGHPWVFSNELQDSPKALEIGEVVELHDAGGEFLAYGFANPHSLITFRELSRKKEDSTFFQGAVVSSDFFASRLNLAQAFRKSWFGSDQSFRLVYGEADDLSGLVIDRFMGRSSSGVGQVVYVVQPHAAGMDLNLKSIVDALRAHTKSSESNFERFVILRRDASSREREGIAKEPIRVLDLAESTEVLDVDFLKSFRFAVSGVMGSTLSLSADLVSGQKTGFFFDQLQNIRLLETLLLRKLRHERSLKSSGAGAPFQVLDLCSYVGQWSAHLMQTLHERESLPAEFTCVDASESALKIASLNLNALAKEYGIESKVKIKTQKADVLEVMEGVQASSYDLVIADPPAFIKSRKSIPQGKQAYSNLFQSAIEKTKKGGLVVCCSCSQLLSHEDFNEVLGKATRRSKRRVRWLAEGSPSFDHFTRLEFNEGQYLKCRIGQVEET